MKNFLVILSALFFSVSAYSQTGTIKGFVYDKESGEPVIFTTVQLKGTDIGITTDVNGYYSITKIPPGEYTLMVSNISYGVFEEKVTIGKNKIISKNILLKGTSKRIRHI